MTMMKALIRAHAAQAAAMTTLQLARRIDALRSVTVAAYDDTFLARDLIALRRACRLELARRAARINSTRGGDFGHGGFVAPTFVTHETAPVAGMLATTALAFPVRVF